MGKNRTFKNTYLVTIEGKTSNGFQSKLFDDVIHGIGQAFGVNSQQCSVNVKPLDTTGDYDSVNRKLKQAEEK